MRYERDAADRRRGDLVFVVQKSDDFAHQRFKPALIFHSSKSRIRGVFRALWDNQDRVASAGDELIGQLILIQHVLDVIAVAVKVDDQIDALARLERFGNDDADGAVLVMLGAEGFEAVRAAWMRIRRILQIAQHELAVIE